MGLKVYDLPPGGLENNAVATPSNDITFTWTYDQEELDKTEPLPKDIQIIKKTEPDASEDEVITLAKQKRYRKTKTIEMRKQYEDFEKEGKLEELPLYNIFNPKFQPTPPPSENGMSIVMRPQAAVHMMKVEIPLEAIDELNTHIEEELDGATPAQDLLEMEGMDKHLAFVLAKNGIVTMEDLAEQAIDDLIDIEDMDEERAGKLIMTARAPWFAEDAADEAQS